MRVIIPASGSVPSEMTADFGHGLGALLPIAGRPSLLHILDRLPADADLVVTTDAGDDIVPQLLSSWQGQVEIVPASSVDSLGAVLHAALTRLTERWGDTSAHIVLSDTLTDVPIPPDTIGVQVRTDTFRYTTVQRLAQGLEFEPVNTPKLSDDVCVGVFHISDAGLMRRALDECELQWFPALCIYDRSAPLAAHHVGEWVDLGHLPTYYRARRGAYLSRHFNALRLTSRNTVVKSSTQVTKIQAEVAWYQTLPQDLQTFAPRFLGVQVGEEEASYEIEYVASPTIAEQLVWGRMAPDYWVQLFEVLDALLPALWRETGQRPPASVTQAASHHMYVEKTLARVEEFVCSPIGQSFSRPFAINDVAWDDLRSVVAAAADRAGREGLVTGHRWTFIHGDLFPGNMFFDRRTERILAIDPRGSFGVPGPYGDPVYDLAKLSHSFLGGYDMIVSGLHSSTSQLDGAPVSSALPSSVVQQAFLPHVTSWLDRLEVPMSTLRLAEALLFLSMLPLHSDAPSRQLALLNRGLEALTCSAVT